jgi:molecular chaperone HscB
MMSRLWKIPATGNYFELFSLPAKYSLDHEHLEQRYIELARAVHPDFAPTDPDSQIRAMELSAKVNEAHKVLADDIQRAEYLLQLNHAQGEIRRVKPETIERIFEMREALSTAQSTEDEEAQKEIREQAAEWYQKIVAELADHLDAGQMGPDVQELVNTARYVQKIVGA